MSPKFVENSLSVAAKPSPSVLKSVSAEMLGYLVQHYSNVPDVNGICDTLLLYHNDKLYKVMTNK